VRDNDWLCRRRKIQIRNLHRKSDSSASMPASAADLTNLKAIMDESSDLFVGRGWEHNFFVYFLADFAYRQQDSHEFLMEFLFALHQLCEKHLRTQLKVIDAPNSSPCVKLVNDSLIHSISPVTRHFHTVVEMNMTCQQCFHSKDSKLEVYRDFSLNIGGDSRETLEELLCNFFVDENREADCDHCSSKNCPMKVSAAVRFLPTIMIIHLKRFQFDVRYVITIH
jgi:ubiquitin C-terminal hydrolase